MFIFRHASVSSTYPCKLVSWSVRHTFGFPISGRPSVATVTKEVATITKEVATVTKEVDTISEEFATITNGVDNITKEVATITKEVATITKLFETKCIFPKVFLRNVPDLRIF